jgi:hypothetical protein
MAQVFQDKQGPIWPLGLITVVTPGIPVSIMSLVDSLFTDAPETPTPGTVGADEYTSRAYSIIFMPLKAGAGTMLGANTANKLVYVVRKPIGSTSDTGGIVIALRPGDPAFVLTGNPMERNIFNLYAFYIDADTAGDGVQVTAIIA